MIRTEVSLAFRLFNGGRNGAKQQHEMTKFNVLWRTCTPDDGEVFILFLDLNATPTNLVPG